MTTRYRKGRSVIKGFNHPDAQRIHRQMEFIREIDRAKTILRQNTLADGSRRENDAEHSWHLCMMALILAEHASEPIDLCRVINMLLVHDIVEIDAGDTFAYDEAGHVDKADRERQAAERIFGLLPEDQGEQLKALWVEFERRETPEAKFAAAIDRLQPMLENFWTRGGVWTKHNVPAHRVRARNDHIRAGSETLGQYARALIDRAVELGFLSEQSD